MDAIPDSLLGPVAGVATSCLWVTTSLFFTAASQRLGTTLVNATRLAMAVVMLGLSYRFVSGEWWPAMAAWQWWSLAVSGFLGLAVCDQCLFKAFVEIGPRRTQLVMTTSPLFALAFGLLFLGEALSLGVAAAVVLTLAGVAWVVTERVEAGGAFSVDARVYRRGIGLGLIAAACQAAGAWLGKSGMGHGVLDESERLDPLPASLVRMVFGFASMLPLLLLWAARHRRAPPAGGRRWTSGMILVALGAIGGPYLGVWFSLIAFDKAPIGVAQTLCSLSPVLILPLVGPVYGERVSARAVCGAMIAMAGSVLVVLGQVRAGS